MLLSLAQWLQALSPEFGYFRVFQYLTFRAVMAALTALLIGLVAGPSVIRRLRELKIGHPSVAMPWRPTWPRVVRRLWAVSLSCPLRCPPYCGWI